MSNNTRIDLEDIPGLGPVRREALAEAGIVDLEGLLRTRMAELSAIRGIGQWQARKIWEFLRHRGLLVEGETEAGAPVVLVQPHTPAEAEVVVEVFTALETQAAVEAKMEAEIHDLEDAIQEQIGAPAAAGGGELESVLNDEARAAEDVAREQEMEELDPTEEGTLPGDAESDFDAEGNSHDEETEDDEASLRERIRGQREQLPESALALIEAIRQASVSRQLTRQLTRLLIIAGEFESDTRPLPDQTRRHASELLDEADRLIRRAVEKCSFEPARQKELASRIRKRRKELESMLEEAEA